MMYTNAVYWPNYRVYHGDSPAQLNYGCINRVHYAFASVTADGGVLVSGSKVDQRVAVTDITPLASSVTSMPIPGHLVTVSRAPWGLLCT